MSQVLSQLISSVAFGEIQSHPNLAIQPIIRQAEEGPHYLSLNDALASDALTVTEVDESGSVPELLATNTGAMPILIIDGEELIGAMQNRVLNTTVLLPGHSRTVLPVSCVEEGRWDSVSEEFSDSGNILNSTLRARKHSQVSANLAEDGSRHSDQYEIWQGVEEIASGAGLPESPTGAMRDVYRHLDSDLNALIHPFVLVPAQVGMAVFISGEFAGIEYISRPEVFARAFEKLLRSYALDATLGDGGSSAAVDPSIAPGILAAINSIGVQTYEAVGSGQEHRITRDDVVGSALTLDDNVLHLSLLSAKRAHGTNHMPAPFPRSYWVSPGRLLAGCYPGDQDPAEARGKLSAMLDSGIRAVVSLMEETEKSHNGKSFVPYQDALVQMGIERGIPVVVLRKPVRDMTPPTRKYMREILDQIDGLISMGAPVYVHCWGGRGRTGTVVGYWLERHGIATGDDVIEHIKHLRRDDPTNHKPSPQTPEQFELVRSWRRGE